MIGYGWTRTSSAMTTCPVTQLVSQWKWNFFYKSMQKKSYFLHNFVRSLYNIACKRQTTKINNIRLCNPNYIAFYKWNIFLKCLWDQTNDNLRNGCSFTFSMFYFSDLPKERCTTGPNGHNLWECFFHFEVRSQNKRIKVTFKYIPEY